MPIKTGIRALNGESGRVLAIDPNIADAQALSYEIDRVRRVAGGEDIFRWRTT